MDISLQEERENKREEGAKVLVNQLTCGEQKLA